MPQSSTLEPLRDIGPWSNPSFCGLRLALLPPVKARPNGLSAPYLNRFKNEVKETKRKIGTVRVLPNGISMQRAWGKVALLPKLSPLAYQEL